MAVEDQIMQDLTPGMRITIAGAMTRYKCSYSTAQKALRRLWRQEVVIRLKREPKLEYEGKQERLI